MSEIEKLSRTELESIMLEGDERVRSYFRGLVRRSLFATTKIVVCYTMDGENLMTARSFKDRSDWLQHVILEVKRGLLEDPRSLIKTTACTRTIPLWISFQRGDARYDPPEEMEYIRSFREKFPHIQGVDNRILIAGDSKENAARFTGSTKAQYETNGFLRWLFPELIWTPGRHEGRDTWTDDEFFLPGRRDPTLSDPFLRAVGIESKIVGGRADVVVYNDLIGDTNWRSQTERERRREYIRTSSSLLQNQNPDSPYGGVLLIEGNRWCLDDVNSVVHDEWGHWEIWRRSIFKCYVHGYGNCGRRVGDEDTLCAPTNESVWPERYPDAAALAKLEIEKGAEIWAAQWLNDPTIAGDLDASSFVTCTLELRNVNVEGVGVRRLWCAVHTVAEKEYVVPIAALANHAISVDVASSTEAKACRTAIAWCAVDRATNTHYVLDVRADRWAPDDAVRAAYELGVDVKEKLLRDATFLVEKVAAQTYFATALGNYARLRGKRLAASVELIPPTRGVAKEDRIRRAVGNLLGQRQLALRAGLQLPRTEVRHFPTGSLDTLDAITQFVTWAQGGVRTNVEDTRREARARARAQRFARGGSTGAML